MAEPLHVLAHFVVRFQLQAALEVLQGLLQAAMVVEHHAPELQGLHMVLVEQQGLLEALGSGFKIAQFSVGLSQTFIGIDKVDFLFQSFFEGLDGFLQKSSVKES